MKNYPRFFTHATYGFQDGTAYLRVDKKKDNAVIVSKRGSEMINTRYTENSCEYYVKRGWYKEITAEEAKKLIKKV